MTEPYAAAIFRLDNRDVYFTATVVIRHTHSLLRALHGVNGPVCPSTCFMSETTRRFSIKSRIGNLEWNVPCKFNCSSYRSIPVEDAQIELYIFPTVCKLVGFSVLTAVIKKITAFCVIMPCIYCYIFVFYLTTLFSKVRLHSVEWRIICEWWIGKDVEGSGRGLI
jgi:hypothetical protein